MTENMAVFFNNSEFAVAAIYNGATPVNVIFDNAYTEQFGAAGTHPFVTVDAAAFSAAARGQTLQLGATVYTIENIETDGTGIVRLELLRG